MTKPIELTGEVAENGEDPWGNQRVGFEVEGKIDRREFGLDWNQASQRQPPGRQRRQARRQRLGRQGSEQTVTKILGISGSLRRLSHNTGLLRAAAEHAPEGVDDRAPRRARVVAPFNEDRENDRPVGQGAAAGMERTRF